MHLNKLFLVQRPKFWQSSQKPSATTGASLLCSPRSTAGSRGWGSVVGYAQHLLMLTTMLNAGQADAVNPAMLCDRFIDRLHPPSLRRDIRRYAREHADVTFHQAGAEAQLDARGC